MDRPRKAILASVVLSVLGLVHAPGAPASEPPALPDAWHPLPAADLDAMRGGYATPSGMTVSFGFERVAFVNGDLVASTRVLIPDVARMSADDARALSQLGRTTLVQVGDGNGIQAGSLGGLVIQNTLDDQKIATTTTLDIAVDTLGVFQAANFASALQDAIAGSSTTP